MFAANTHLRKDIDSDTSAAAFDHPLSPTHPLTHPRFGAGHRFRGAEVSPDQLWAMKASLHVGCVEAFGRGEPQTDEEREMKRQLKAALELAESRRNPFAQMGAGPPDGAPNCPQS